MGRRWKTSVHFGIGSISLTEAATSAFVRPMLTASMSPKLATASEATTGTSGPSPRVTESRLAHGSQLGLEGVPVEGRCAGSSAVPRAFD
jgi:hypothetical protein